MIKFEGRDNRKIISFLDANLPPRIKEELFYYYTRWENKGKMCENKSACQPHQIIDNLIEKNFIVRFAHDADHWNYPKEYILLWTKLKDFIKNNDSLSVELEKYSLVSINSACKMLDISRPSMYKIINEKKIPVVEILSQKRIQLKDLLNYIKENKSH